MSRFRGEKRAGTQFVPWHSGRGSVKGQQSADSHWELAERLLPTRPVSFEALRSNPRYADLVRRIDLS